MFGSNRRIIIAAIGFLIFSGILYASYQLYQASEQKSAGYHYQPAHNPVRLKIAPGDAYPEGYQPHCENPQKNENSDLCAQWAAVDQVMEANRLASVNVRLALFIAILTLIGTGFVGWTFLETRATSRRELRAYLFPDGAGTVLITKRGPTKGCVLCAVRIKNSGQTPAFEVWHWADMKIFQIGPWNQFPIPPKTPFDVVSVPPDGMIHKHLLSEVVSREMIEQIRAGTHAIYVWGRVEYLDSFGERRYTNYRLAHTGAWPVDENTKFNFVFGGNDAS